MHFKWLQNKRTGALAAARSGPREHSLWSVLRGVVLMSALLAAAGILVGILFQGERAYAAQTQAEPVNLTNVWEKVAAGEDIRILIIGDSIGAGAGTDNSDGGAWQWFCQLSSYLTQKYYEDREGAVTVTNVSMGGSTSYSGYVRSRLLGNEIQYDLVILCYGHNDEKEKLPVQYEALVRSVRALWPGCEMISILESSLQEKTDAKKIAAIRSLCEHYDIPLADTGALFCASGFSEEQLTADGLHPGNLGQNLYFQAVAQIVEEKMLSLSEDLSASGESSYVISALHGDVSSYDNFVYIPASPSQDQASSAEEDSGTAAQFVRTDDLTWVVSGVCGSGILGIDYTYYYGNNPVWVYLDGELLTVSTAVYEYDLADRGILVVHENCSVQESIAVVFETKEQADGFHGMCLSWGDGRS